MFIVTNDNSDAHLIRLQQQIDELRAEIDRLKAASSNAPNASDAEFDRRAYMRRYMAKRRAEKKAAGRPKASSAAGGCVAG